jgi:hypothetical protein
MVFFTLTRWTLPGILTISVLAGLLSIPVSLYWSPFHITAWKGWRWQSSPGSYCSACRSLSSCFQKYSIFRRSAFFLDSKVRNRGQLYADCPGSPDFPYLDMGAVWKVCKEVLIIFAASIARPFK